MTLNTRICKLFDIEHPILNAPMGGGDAPGALAAAVSEGGGLGMIGGTSFGGVEWVREQVRRARSSTTKPFGVGFITHVPGTGELIRAALDEGVRVVAYSFGDPSLHVQVAHDAGATVICQVRTLDDARRAADAGVDVITAQGTEAGGHTGTISTFPLVPAVVDEVAPIPVIAAGGIGDGRGIAAALVLGAEGVWLGTVFLATPEAGVPAHYKQRVIDAGTDDTILTTVFDVAAGMPWPAGVAGRAIRNRFTDEWHGREDELRAVAAQHQQQLHNIEDADTAALYAGPAARFVDGMCNASELVRRLADDAAESLRSRADAVLR